jgi:plasmid stability protein
MEALMAQLVVRELSDETKERLRARAKAHGRSLEAEVRDVLEKAAREAPMGKPATGLGTQIVEAMRGIGLTNEDVEELERIIAEGRKDWRTPAIEFDR